MNDYSDLTFTDGLPAKVQVGMVVRTADGDKLIGDVFPDTYYDFPEGGGMIEESAVRDGGCGCCSDTYRVLAWAWLPGFED